MSTKSTALGAAALLALISATPASAVDFSFTGNFAGDADVQFFNFNVGGPSNVTFRTWSYAGGTNAASVLIARGGFDPILAVFDASGALIGQNDDGSGVPSDVTGLAYDTLLTVALNAGSYSVAVMQYNNFAIGPNVANGFSQPTSATTFTAAFGCSQGFFCDAGENNRDSHWAFDILNVASAEVVPGTTPIPGALPLFAGGIGLIGLIAHRRKRKQAV